MQNIRDKETQLLTKLLQLSASGTNSAMADFNDQWKVLIYDQRGRDIISPLLSVPALRQKGVTLHLLLHSEREAIPDAPAVYFIAPTIENLKRVTEDCSKQLYRTIYIHFTTRVERPVLEGFAHDLVTANAHGMVSKIFDEYLDVIALEPTLFTLNLQDSFLTYNEPSASEQQIRSFMTRVATGLLCAVRVLGAIPIIRAPPGGAAQMLAAELNSLLRENLAPRGAAASLFEDCIVHDRARPIMLILDRSVDLFPILQHNSLYQALVSDVLDFQLNRVTVDVTEKGSSSSKRKTYDLSAASDSFLQRHAGSSFPAAVEANEKELAEVSQRENAIRSRPDFAKMSDTDIAMASGGDNKNRDLSEAIESLPDILHRKALLEAHTNVMQNVMKHVAAREIPTYFELEQALLQSGARGIDKQATLALLRDGTKGVMLDKARLLALIAVTLLTGERGTDTNMEEYDAAFQQGCAEASAKANSNNNNGNTHVHVPTADEITQCLAGVQFLRRLLSLQGSPLNRLGGSGGSSLGLSSLLNTATSHATSLITKFLAKFTPFYATRVIHGLCEGRGSAEDESFLTFDPRARDGTSASPTNAKYSDAIVFVLGGGCYAEYFNLQELLKDAKSGTASGNLKNIIYGCTDLVSGDDFIKQLQRLSSTK